MTGFMGTVPIPENGEHAHPSARQARSWTGERIGRLGFLMGLGWDAKRIADDPIITSTPNNVYRQAQRCGLAFHMADRLPHDASVFFEAAAAKRSLTREALIRLLLLEIAGDPNLLDNILDF